MNRLKTNIGLFASLGLFGLTLISFLFLVSSTSSALTVSGSSPLTASATAAVHVTDACTFSGTVDTAHTATINPGTSNTNGIGRTILTTICNDSGGYAIYAVGYTGEEIGGTNSTKLVGGTTGQTIDTNASVTESGSTSKWAMKLYAHANDTNPPTVASSYSNFNVVPASYTLVASKNASTGNASSTISTTYGAYISGAQAADTYTGKVKYIMVHPANETPPVEVACANNKICYNANTNIKEGTMGQQTGNANAEVTLLASNFSKNGYGFAGWNTKPDYSGDFYGPNESITVPSTASSGGTPLYAVWVKSSGTLQGWTGCSSLTKADEATDILSQSIRALTDQRDGQTYAVAKLADGNCWMIENLRLESTNSDNATGDLAQGYGKSTTYGNFSGLASSESTNFSNSSIANSLYYSGTQSGTASINIGTTNYPGYRMPRYNNANTSARASSPTSGYASIYSYGNYYTWHAAIADLTYNDANNSSVTNTSLCPSGWRLPQGGDKTRITSNDDNDFWNLIVDELNNGTNPANYDSQTIPYYTGTAEAGPVDKLIRSYPNNFLYSGYFNTSSAGNRGSCGFYWSSTALDYHVSYSLYLTSSYIYPGTYNYSKSYGRSIRCVSGT